ncbi:hypothetical protein AVEN_172035-1 [Araneus ventricosus]|uniref:Uncharacterized protein n=1 Tax=Araneus ventricosus TaxID=182803 RepID=A0A4Y2B3K8_ARAVE|nr:hypothetical protein AVEN_172035-1 [Araneus ventricosus]
MDPACHVGTIQGHGGSIMIWGVFSWTFLESLVHVPTSLIAIRKTEIIGTMEPHWHSSKASDSGSEGPSLKPDFIDERLCMWAWCMFSLTSWFKRNPAGVVRMSGEACAGSDVVLVIWPRLKITRSG